MKDITLHTMEYLGDIIESDDVLVNFSITYYDEYKRIYERCFHKMREELELYPVDACPSAEELIKQSNDIFLLLENDSIIGSVAIYGNEIDDLIVEDKHQHKGYALVLLRFAVAYMQKRNLSPIILRVTGWNKRAIEIYQKAGFMITKTEIIKQKS